MNTLILSGGGVLGFVHLGALQYLVDYQHLLNVKKFIGTSVGAIIGYLLIIGFSPIEICLHLIQNDCLSRMDHFNVVNLFHGTGGAFSYDVIHNTLMEMTLSKLSFVPTLSQLPELYEGKQLIVCTYNFTQKQEQLLCVETHPDLNCLTALRMSSNLPFLFEPFQYEEEIFFDGVLTSNFPLHAIDPIHDQYIGISIHQNFKNSLFLASNTTTEDDDKKIALFDLFWQILKIPMMNLEHLKNNSVLKYGKHIRIEVSDFAPWHFRLQKSEILDLFSTGYHQTQHQYSLKN